ncbi:unnamed protein product [Auanema sp. JU1783]|nr:unnamed protein product [Auanema sp. JU1783]
MTYSVVFSEFSTSILILHLSIFFLNAEATPAIFDNQVTDLPTVKCMDDHLRLVFQTQKPFHGRIFVKGMVDKEPCEKRFIGNKNTTIDFELENGSCNMRRQRMNNANQKGIEQSITVIISFHDTFITKVDRAFRCTCFYMEMNTVVTQSLTVSQLPTTDLQDNARLPTCTYTVRKDSIDGPLVQYARVGDTVYHVWECDNDMYSMYVHSCFVDDGSGSDQKALLDESGCAIDTLIVPDLQYSSGAGNLAYAEVNVFKFADKVTTYFQCAITTCLVAEGGCENVMPPKCGPIQKKASRKRRNTELLTEKFNTVDVASHGITVLDLMDETDQQFGSKNISNNNSYEKPIQMEPATSHVLKEENLKSPSDNFPKAMEKHIIRHVYKNLRHLPPLNWIWADKTVTTKYMKWQLGFQIVYNNEIILSLYCFLSDEILTPRDEWCVTADVLATIGDTKISLKYEESSTSVTNILSMSKSALLDSSNFMNDGDLHITVEISNVKLQNQRECLYTDLDEEYHRQSADVILRLENEEIYCHSQYLRWNSKVFRKTLDQLEKNETGKPYTVQITLDSDIQLQHFKHFIEFLYTHTPPVSEQNVKYMAHLAHKYEVETIQTVCGRFLREYTGSQLSSVDIVLLAFATNCWAFMGSGDEEMIWTHSFISYYLTFCCLFTTTIALLSVQRNEIREYDKLDGLWTFVRETNNGGDIGLANHWNTQDLRSFKNHTVMPVPSSYNDIIPDAEHRDHIGWVWYEQRSYIPLRDVNSSFLLRFASVNYYSVVFVNGDEVGRHVGGHLPFEFDVSNKVKIGQENKITVAVNNTLSWDTVPQADFNYQKRAERNISDHLVSRLPEGSFKNVGLFDFFNYAGILRSVYLMKLPRSRIDDVTITAEHLGSFAYQVITNQNNADEDIVVYIYDDNGTEVYNGRGLEGKGHVPNVTPWWPRGMGEPNLYSIKVELVRSSTGDVLDVFRESFGFRTVSWTNKQLMINSKPFYCLGFGMHEDFEIHGRGYNEAVMTKDLNLVEWMNGNCYRTSHYPYAEERMYENDRRGIACIVETPAVGLKGFPKNNNALHMNMVKDMINRDRNHPSVIMWSIANEPHTEKDVSRNYFKNLVNLAREMDPTRPITTVYGPSNFDNDQTADLMDIICVNRYYGWYIDMGHLDWVNQSVYWDISLWHQTFNKPIIVTEYGADSMPGLNQEPSVDFSEQYQNELIERTHEAFDALRAQDILSGEMIWNFADFMTGMSTTRAVGNHKGVFTRGRQPKIAAYTLRRRYGKLFRQN